jgi:hypothetical protein
MVFLKTLTRRVALEKAEALPRRWRPLSRKIEFRSRTARIAVYKRDGATFEKL